MFWRFSLVSYGVPDLLPPRLGCFMIGEELADLLEILLPGELLLSSPCCLWFDAKYVMRDTGGW